MTLLALSVLQINQPIYQKLELTPSDDIWIYPNASDPQSDVYLRVWGSNGAAVAGKDDDLGEFSYSFLRFNTSRISKSLDFRRVRLVLTHIANAGFTPDVAKKSPLQLRTLEANFTEKTWSNNLASKFVPGEVVSFTTPVASTDGKEFTVTLEIKPDVFTKQLKAAKDVWLAYALTSTINPADNGRSSIYKFYSKDNQKPEWKPQLIVEWK